MELADFLECPGSLDVETQHEEVQWVTKLLLIELWCW